MQLSSDLLSGLGQFFTNLFRDIANGLIFFGGPLEMVIAAFDILITTLVVYYILRLLRDSRAWQLLKGLILIIAFALAGSLSGLSTVGFLLNNTISVLAIAFVIIFQPELRRALETVGRNSFNVLTSASGGVEYERGGSMHNLIESIVRACEKMSESRTGALIIVERQTRLTELLEQENVVNLDAAVSATFLLQIFYKGSPLHDGAVLIRDGRISGARIHVPLSDNYNLRKDFGTRHRAAVGASEMGDTIAVVVSEERGSISLAMEGRLFVLDNADALRTLLHKLMNPDRPARGWASIFRNSRNSSRSTDKATLIDNQQPALQSGSSVVSAVAARPQAPRRQRILLLTASLAISIVLFLYVQVTINPIDTRAFTLTLAYEGIDVAENK